MTDKLDVVEKEIRPFLEELNLDLADIEYVKEDGYNYLRIYVEALDRVTTLDDCINLSSKIDEIVDNIIQDRFYLEVSTPGIERKLKKEKDFIRFNGKEIYIKTKNNIDGKKVFIGKLLDFKDNNIYIRENQSDIVIPLEKTKIVRLHFNLSENIFKGGDEDEI